MSALSNSSTILQLYCTPMGNSLVDEIYAFKVFSRLLFRYNNRLSTTWAPLHPKQLSDSLSAKWMSIPVHGIKS